MQLRLLKAKLHQATVTATHLSYHGSVSIDQDLMDAVGLLEHEAVMIGNLNNGSRAETYVLVAPRGSGQIQLNGALARLAAPGDRLIIMAFAYMEPKEVAKHQPKVVVLDEKNRILEHIYTVRGGE